MCIRDREEALREHVDLDEVANVAELLAPEQRGLLGEELGVVGARPVDVGAGEHHELRDPVLGHGLEHLAEGHDVPGVVLPGRGAGVVNPGAMNRATAKHDGGGEPPGKRVVLGAPRGGFLPAAPVMEAPEDPPLVEATVEPPVETPAVAAQPEQSVAEPTAAVESGQQADWPAGAAEVAAPEVPARFVVPTPSQVPAPYEAAATAATPVLPGREPVAPMERGELARVDADLLDDLLNNAGEVSIFRAVSYTHLRAHETVLDLVCRLLLEKQKAN